MLHDLYPKKRQQTKREEIANSISHGIGLIAALVAFPLLVNTARSRGDLAGIIGACIFATSMLMVYFTSTVYHALPRSNTKNLFRLFDHSSIYLLIVGTYSPFMLGSLRGALGWTILAVVWILAIIGITLKTTGRMRSGKVSTGFYLLMGWLILLAIKPMIERVPTLGMFWLVAGGVFFTVGTVAYTKDHKKYYHFVWHLFVIAGSTCHFIAVRNYACC